MSQVQKASPRKSPRHTLKTASELSAHESDSVEATKPPRAKRNFASVTESDETKSVRKKARVSSTSKESQSEVSSVEDSVNEKDTPAKTPRSKKTKAEETSSEVSRDPQQELPSPTSTDIVMTTWNVNGLRACIRNGMTKHMQQHLRPKPHLLFLQEIKGSKSDFAVRVKCISCICSINIDLTLSSSFPFVVLRRGRKQRWLRGTLQQWHHAWLRWHCHAVSLLT